MKYIPSKSVTKYIDAPKVVTSSRFRAKHSIRSLRITRFEHFLLFITVGALPLNSQFPTLGGASILYIMFGILAVYLCLWRTNILFQALLHPVFLTGYLFLFFGILLETFHNSYDYQEPYRIFLMFIGGVLIASLCRTQQALATAMYGFILAGVLLGGILIFTSYGEMSSGVSNDFREAQRLRSAVFSETSLDSALNSIARYTAQGAILAIGMALISKTGWKQYLFILLGGFCVIGTFMSMSRGAVLTLFLACGIMGLLHGIFRPKLILSCMALGLCLLLLVPSTVMSRFVVTTEQKKSGESIDGRMRLFSATVEHLPEYILLGVGINNFYGQWGKRTGFFDVGRLRVTGTHNCYAQTAVYWGLPGLLTLLFLIWQCYRCTQKWYRPHLIRICLVGFSFSMGMETIFMHQLYAKEFSIVLGMLAGSSLWIWPKRITRSQISSLKTRPHGQAFQALFSQ